MYKVYASCGAIRTVNPLIRAIKQNSIEVKSNIRNDWTNPRNTISSTKYFDWKNNCLFVARFVTC